MDDAGVHRQGLGGDMPFKTPDELKTMMKSNPAMAAKYIKDAQNSGKPVVSRSNPGYGDAAKRRLAEQQKKRAAANKGIGDDEGSFY